VAKMSFTKSLAVARIERIQHLLRGQHLTVYELADGVCLSPAATRIYIAHLRRERQLFIAGWRLPETGICRRWQPLFAWGDGKDAKKPPTDQASYQRRIYAERKKRDPEAHDLYRARQNANRRKVRPDPLTQWIPRAT
jgi:hypothetical protein